MLRIYNYLLYRIYHHEKNVDTPLFTTVIISTLLIWIVLVTALTILSLFIDIPIETSKVKIAFVASSLGLINYLVLIRPMKFLKYNFRKDRKGGIIILVSIVVFFIMFLIVADFNRDKVWKEQEAKQRIGNVSN